MASLKNCKSGLTHGRGNDEVQRLTWLFSRPAFAHVKSELDKLYDHDNKMIIKDLTNSSILAYKVDVLKIVNYIEEHNPFNVTSPNLVDISTGILYPKANAHKALDIGDKILQKMNSIEVKQYKFKKADKLNKWVKKFWLVMKRW